MTAEAERHFGEGAPIDGSRSAGVMYRFDRVDRIERSYNLEERGGPTRDPGRGDDRAAADATPKVLEGRAPARLTHLDGHHAPIARAPDTPDRRA
jgi:hypothetical protein